MEILSEHFDYQRTAWGEIMYGTKQDVQLFGIATNTLLPGEPAGPKRKLNTVDPRGFPCGITTRLNRFDGVYCVLISMPDREPPWKAPEIWEVFAPGVSRYEYPGYDNYKGSAEALIAAGLVKAAHIPGSPGMQKTCVTVSADGTVIRGAHFGSLPPDSIDISIAGENQYLLRKVLPSEISQARLSAVRARDDAYHQRMRKLAHPPMLRISHADSDEVVQMRRSVLRLVWSRPPFTPGLNPM